MKALKEKRIGLRSLWRRGLVILSLFALVFASCNTSGSGEEEKKPEEGPKVVDLKLTAKDDWLGTQYEGRKIDLSGITVSAKYEGDSEWHVLKSSDGYTIRVEPEYAQGVICSETTTGDIMWIPITTYTVTAAYGNQAAIETYGSVVVPITRNSSIGTGGSSVFITGSAFPLPGTDMQYYYDLNATFGVPHDWDNERDAPYVYNSALNLTADWDQEVYVDDLVPQTTKFRLQAQYIDGAKLDLDEVALETEIKVHYSNGHNETGTGEFVVFAGKNDVTNPNWGGSWTDGNGNTVEYIVSSTLNNKTGGLMAAYHPYKSVFHVTSIEAKGVPDYTTSEGLNKLPSIAYYESEALSKFKGDPPYVNRYTPTERLEVEHEATKREVTYFWATKLDAAGITFDITYTNGKTRNLTIKEMIENGMVWLNNNPYDDYLDTFGIDKVRVSSTPAKKLTSDANGLAFNKITDPAVNVNYRGAVASVPVDIWIKCDSFEAQYIEANDSGYITVNVKPTDNDVGGQDAKWYAGKVKATATFSSARGNSKPVEVTFKQTGYEISTNSLGAPTPGERTNAENDNTLGWGLVDVNGSNDYGHNRNFNYSMDFGKAAQWIEGETDDPDEHKWRKGFGQADTTGNNDKIKSVTFYYAIPTWAEWTYHDAAASDGNQKVLKSKLSVEWKNIRVR